MNKKQKRTIFISIFTLLIFFSFVLTIYNLKQKEINELSNQYYTSNHFRLIDKEPNMNKWREVLDSQYDYRIFIEYNNVFRHFIDFNTSWSPPMQSGVFFKENEQRNTAVIGKEMKDYVYSHNGLKYVDFEGTPYEVIGVTGASYASYSDYLILLNSRDIPMKDDAKIVIDGPKKSTLNKIKNKILEEYSSVETVDIENRGLTETVNSTSFGKMFSISSITLIIFSSILYLYFWHVQEKQKLNICIILGVKKINIIKDYMKTILINLSISILIALLLLTIFGRIMNVFQMISIEIIMICLLFLCSAMMVIFIFIYMEFLSKGRKI